MAVRGRFARPLARRPDGYPPPAGHAPPLRTFNTRPTLYPPDTSPGFTADVPTAALAGGTPDRVSAHFSGHQFLYTARPTTDEPLSAGPFTVEGQFKLAIAPNDYDGRPQVILCRASAPVADPVQLAVETAPPLTTRPATEPATRPPRGPPPARRRRGPPARPSRARPSG